MEDKGYDLGETNVLFFVVIVIIYAASGPAKDQEVVSALAHSVPMVWSVTVGENVAGQKKIWIWIIHSLRSDLATKRCPCSSSFLESQLWSTLCFLVSWFPFFGL